MAEMVAVRGKIQGNIIKSVDPVIQKYDGCEVIITILNASKNIQSRSERRQELLKSKRCVVPSGRSVEEIDTEIKELRSERF